MILRYVAQIRQTSFEQSTLKMNHNFFKDQISNLVEYIMYAFYLLWYSIYRDNIIKEFEYVDIYILYPDPSGKWKIKLPET